MCFYSIISALITSNNRLRSIGELLPAILMIGIELIWMRLIIYEKYNGIILVNFGILAALFVSKMIISSVTKMTLPYFHFEIIPLLISTPIMIYLNIQ